VVGWLLKGAGNNPELELQLHTDVGSPYFAQHSWLNRIRWWLARWTIPRADRVRVVSAKIAQFLTTHWQVPMEKIEVRPIAVSAAVLASHEQATNLRASFPQFGKIALAVSRLETEKDVALALEAWAIVTNTIPTAGLIIAGSGREERRLRELSRSLGIEKLVVFAGWVNNLTAYYAMADVVMCTSQYEGYGLALVEAHQVGRPIVSTDVGVARELGATIVEHQPQAVAKAVVNILATQ
jgi:glycosyltransferase involved in cell wall biosynthesis